MLSAVFVATAMSMASVQGQCEVDLQCNQACCPSIDISTSDPTYTGKHPM